MRQWWLLVGSVILSVLSLLTTVVFFFWFVYFLDAIRRKWKFYKNELRCLQGESFDIQQQTLVYNARTEFVKNIFLFFLNLVEWVAFIFARLAFILYFLHEFSQDEGNDHQSTHLDAQPFFSLINITTGSIKIKFSVYSFLFLTNDCFVLSLILMASLCMYLAARIARKSWIKSDKIPFLIAFFLVCLIINQILASFCSSHIFADWFTVILITASFIISLRQYRKLRMVIGWTIVDLFVYRKKRAMTKQVKMKQKFVKLFTIVWTGIILLILSQFLSTVVHTLMLILRKKDTTDIDFSLCKNSIFILPVINDIFAVIFYIKFAIELLGNLFIFIPYVVHGLSTMYTVMWRLYKGKTGYKTHFHNELRSPLIS